MTNTPTAGPGGEFKSDQDIMSEVYEVCNAARVHIAQAAKALEHNPADLLEFWHRLDGVCIWSMQEQNVSL